MDTLSGTISINVYFVLALVALLGDYAVRTTADVLDLRGLWQGVPAPLQGLYSDDQYRASQRYVCSATRIRMVERTVLLAVVCAFWFLGGFGWLDGLVCHAVSSTLGRGLLYLGIVTVSYLLLTVPFDAYRTFSLEASFGFNRTTPGIFVTDRLKELFLLVVIGGSLAAIVVSAFLWLGPGAWLLCLAVVVAFILLTQVLAPVVILPLFNRFKPLPEGELREAVLSYTMSIGLPVEDVYVIDGSRRSSRANAFFTGLGRHRRIVLYDTLIEGHSIDSLVTVLAHEAGHYGRGHILKGVLAASLHAAILLYLLAFFLEQPGLFEAFGVSQSSVYVGFVLFGLLYTPVETALSVLFNMLSRRYEYEADRFAVETTHNPSALAAALRKLSVDNLSNPHPHRFQVLLNYSHPPLAERLASIEGRSP
ncbi:MAG TPA: M48 family peptidase [Dehalococcoidia bacterium]|nr:M48 family peptidase [Dehalococcoidia bacterium]